MILFTPGEINADSTSGVVSPVNLEAHLPRVPGLHYESHY